MVTLGISRCVLGAPNRASLPWPWFLGDARESSCYSEATTPVARPIFGLAPSGLAFVSLRAKRSCAPADRNLPSLATFFSQTLSPSVDTLSRDGGSPAWHGRPAGPGRGPRRSRPGPGSAGWTDPATVPLAPRAALGAACPPRRLGAQEVTQSRASRTSHRGGRNACGTCVPLDSIAIVGERWIAVSPDGQNCDRILHPTRPAAVSRRSMRFVARYHGGRRM